MVGTDGAEACPDGKTKDKRKKTKVEGTVYSPGSPPGRACHAPTWGKG